MKRLLAIPLLFLYTIAISGMMVQLHFCGDELSSWAVNATKAACCCEESGQKDALQSLNDKDCCKDQTIDLKISQEQNTVAAITFILHGLQTGMIAQPVFEQFTATLIEPEHAAYAANAPPGSWQQIPLYKLHQRFTFYG